MRKISKKNRNTRVRVKMSSGNVFADLGLPNSKDLLAKAELAAAIYSRMKQHGLTQTVAAKILGIDQPRVSALVNGRLDLFSTDSLIEYLTALGSDVQISIGNARKNRSGKVTVIYAT